MIAQKYRLTKAFFRESHARPALFRGKFLTLTLYKEGSFPHVRIAVIVSKKIDKSAVGRNRIKRRILGVLQEFLPQLPPSAVFIFRVHSKLDQVSHTDLQVEIAQLVNLPIKQGK